VSSSSPTSRYPARVVAARTTSYLQLLRFTSSFLHEALGCLLCASGGVAASVCECGKARETEMLQEQTSVVKKGSWGVVLRTCRARWTAGR